MRALFLVILFFQSLISQIKITNKATIQNARLNILNEKLKIAPTIDKLPPPFVQQHCQTTFRGTSVR